MSCELAGIVGRGLDKETRDMGWILFLSSMITVANVLGALTGQCPTADESGSAQFIF